MINSLSGTWKVKLDPEQIGIAQEWAKKPLQTDLSLQLPGCIQQLDCLAADYPPYYDLRNSYLGTFFLEKECCISLRPGEYCKLLIGGGAPSCHVWINGRYVTGNIVGLTKVELDITRYVTVGTNRITIAVTEQNSNLTSGMRFEGLNWSGIYESIAIETTGAIFFRNSYISLSNGEAVFCTLAENHAQQAYADTVEVLVENRVFTSKLELKAGQSIQLCIPVDVEGLPRWSFRSPDLITASIRCKDQSDVLCEETFQTGLRELTTQHNRILVDGVPTFFAGAGEEYYSATLVPLSNREIITARFRAMQEYGFNYFRYHTHFPTETELCVADELGIMVSTEFGVVSNFNKMSPLDKALELMTQCIEQTRRHPSMICYGLGNEGSQLMVESAEECEKARTGYEEIKKHTTNQFAIIAYGIQGELPELKNDFETPHLWSDNFTWAYNGLTEIPWSALKETVGNRPNIIHEYGKFCSWPSREDEKNGTIPDGAKPTYGTESNKWLKKNGLEALEEQLVATSRRAADCAARIVLEEGRRQDYVDGYVLWTFFRNSWRGRGLCDDVGRNTNGSELLFKNGPNAEVAILMDRGFHARSFPCQIDQQISFFVSNYSLSNVDGQLTIRLTCADDAIYVHTQHTCAAVGETGNAGTICFTVPARYSQKELRLCAVLEQEGRVLAENSWQFWSYDISADRHSALLLHIEDERLYRALKHQFPNAHRLSSYDSIRIGCRSWTQPQLAQTAKANRQQILISDVYDETIQASVEGGCTVLLLDSGRLPKQWFCGGLYQELEDRDVSRFFTSFRCGWDRGPLATVVQKDARLGDFSSSGYCDLRFFDMVQSARSLDIKAISKDTHRKADSLISSLVRLKSVQEKNETVQDVNAQKEQNYSMPERFAAREQSYLAAVGEHLLVSTLYLTDNPAGISLLKQIIAGIRP